MIFAEMLFAAPQWKMKIIGGKPLSAEKCGQGFVDLYTLFILFACLLDVN
jgi:hypothetical protein